MKKMLLFCAKVCRTQTDVNSPSTVSFADIESSMYKRRRLNQPALPTTVDDVDGIIAASRYATTTDGPFYRGCVRANDDTNGTACVFASPKQLSILSSAKSAFMDGTFFTVPRLFYQLFTIFVTVQCHVFPVCFVLMTRKTKVLYKAVFEHIKTLVPNFFEPVTVMADYEDASVQALTEVFDNGLVVKGCWFHFAKAVIKRVKTVGLAIAFRNDATVRKCIKGLTCLPLLPHDKIGETLDLLFQYATAVRAQYKDNVVTMFLYIRRRWIECSSVGTERLFVKGINGAF